MNEKRVSRRERVKSVFNNILTVLIVLLFVVSAFFGGYFLGGNYDFTEYIPKFSFNFGGNKTEAKEETKSSSIEITDSAIVNLVPDLLRGSECWTIEEFVTDKKIVANDIPSQRAYAVAENNSFYFAGKETITLQEMTEEIQKYFGTNYHFYPELVSYESTACPQYQYNEQERVFVRAQRDCRGTCPNNTTAYKVVKANTSKDTLTIVIKVLFGSKEGTNFYGDFNKTKLITNNPNEVSSALSQGAEYIFTFQKENGRYVFLSSEPSK